jgi:hypothetical protein
VRGATVGVAAGVQLWLLAGRASAAALAAALAVGLLFALAFRAAHGRPRAAQGIAVVALGGAAMAMQPCCHASLWSWSTAWMLIACAAACRLGCAQLRWGENGIAAAGMMVGMYAARALPLAAPPPWLAHVVMVSSMTMGHVAPATAQRAYQRLRQKG